MFSALHHILRGNGLLVHLSSGSESSVVYPLIPALVCLLYDYSAYIL